MVFENTGRRTVTRSSQVVATPRAPTVPTLRRSVPSPTIRRITWCCHDDLQGASRTGRAPGRFELARHGLRHILIAAEEKGITKENIDQQLKSEDPDAGHTGGHQRRLRQDQSIDQQVELQHGEHEDTAKCLSAASRALGLTRGPSGCGARADCTRLRSVDPTIIWRRRRWRRLRDPLSVLSGDTDPSRL